MSTIKLMQEVDGVGVSGVNTNVDGGGVISEDATGGGGEEVGSYQRGLVVVKEEAGLEAHAQDDGGLLSSVSDKVSSVDFIYYITLIPLSYYHTLPDERSSSCGGGRCQCWPRKDW